MKFWDQSNGYHHGLSLRCNNGRRRMGVLSCGCFLAPLLEHLPFHLVSLPHRDLKSPESNIPFCLNYLSYPSAGVSHERGLTFPFPVDELLTAIWCGLSQKSASPQEPAWALMKHCLLGDSPRAFHLFCFYCCNKSSQIPLAGRVGGLKRGGFLPSALQKEQ